MDDQRWDKPLSLPDGPAPLGVRIVEAIAAAIRAGRFRPGEALPSSRRLAEQLGVHRNTVLGALDELRAEGWVVTERAKATRVAPRLPAPALSPSAPAPPPLPFSLADRAPSARTAAPPETDAALALGGGSPDLSLVPWEPLARAYRSALKRASRRVLGYGDPRGTPALRRALAAWLRARRGLAIDERHVLVTRGSQMALALAALAILRPGDEVVVERLGYAPAWDALRLAGASLIPAPIDASGLDVDAVERATRGGSVRLVYATPHHQYPTTVALAEDRRARLLDLAAERRFAVLEDDYDHEFHYEGRPLLPVAAASRAGGGAASVVYAGTLSKILAPGLRVGFLVAHPDVVERAAALRRVLDRQGDLALEEAVAELLEDGEILRHANRMRLVYRARRDALAAALRRELGGALAVEPPRGGMALWARVEGASAVRFAEEAARLGVEIRPAARFALDGADEPFVRVAFAGHAETELARAAALLGRAFAEACRATSSPTPGPRASSRPA